MTDILATVNTESVCPSFDASVEFLGDKYSRRGIFGGLTAEAAALDRRILATRLENPSSFIYEDAMASDYRNRYRTGSADGKPVMTVDDFFRLIRDEARRSEKAADASARAAAVISRENTDRRIMREARPACPYSVMEARDVGSAYSAGKRRQVIIGGEEREMRVVKPGSNRKIGFFRLADKYLPDDPLVPAKKSYRNASGTIAAISLILVFTLAFLQRNNEAIPHFTDRKHALNKREIIFEISCVEIMDAQNPSPARGGLFFVFAALSADLLSQYGLTAAPVLSSNLNMLGSDFTV